MSERDAIKVAVCEALIAVNGNDPIVPPTAINWIGDAITAAIADGLGIPPDLPAGTVAAALRVASDFAKAWEPDRLGGLTNEQTEALRRAEP